MSDPAGGDFFEHFIEDFFAECEEHLTTARRVLLELEGSAGPHAAAPALLQELFRTMHTLKGLSGMVGLSSAEQVAHALEDTLRALQDAATPFVPANVDALLAGVDVLERCIAARRTGEGPPVTAPLLARLAQLAESPRGAGTDPRDGGDVHEPHARDAEREHDTIFHFAFVPSRELNERGIGVESVRARLRLLGELLDAKPRVTAGGIAFDFWVSVAAGLEPEADWRADGMTWTRAAGQPGNEPNSAAGPPVPPLADAAAAPATAVAPAAAASASVVRVDLARLDAVMRLVGDLVISRSRLEETLSQPAGERTAAAWDALEETNVLMERQLRRLRDGIMRIRLVPVGEVFERLRFAVRDAARESGRLVRLELHGQTTEIDKLVVDRMLEPLLHLVRNAVSHGIELPTERVARGKPAQGTLTLRAAASGDRIVVQVEDDGAGIDLDVVEARAQAHSLLGTGERLTTDSLLDVLCAPGFSTRDGADMTSGRGVGMDVVRSTVRALAGEISLHTVAGKGTQFVIELPLTLMIVDALLVEIGGQQMAVPQPVLREILQVDASAIVQFENNEVISYRGGVLPLLNLARLFGFPLSSRAQVFLLVVGTEAAPVGLVVDRLYGMREIVVHPVVDPLVAVPGVSGATELGDGRVSLILDSAAIVRLAHEQRQAAPPPTGRRPATSRPAAAAVSFTSQ